MRLSPERLKNGILNAGTGEVFAIYMGESCFALIYGVYGVDVGVLSKGLQVEPVSAEEHFAFLGHVCAWHVEVR